jgi:PAS domain S-box-containing protein
VKAELHFAESRRLAALRGYDILDTPREAEFDDIVELVSAICEAPISVINLIDAGRQWFKAEVGLGVRETPIDSSLCAHAILQPDLFVVPDTTKDVRFHDNPLVTGEPRLRFYAGALLETSDGLPLGTICVLDYAPRDLNEKQRALLRLMAKQIMKLLELRRLNAREHELRLKAEALAGAATVSPHELLLQGVVDYAIYMLDPNGRVMSWNPGAERIKGYSTAEILGEHFSRFYVDEDQAAGLPAFALQQAREQGRFTTEAWRVRKGGARFWAMVVIDPIYRDGELVGFAKITRDMTEQREAELKALESERRFRLLVEGVTDYAIYMLSPEGIVTNWNAGAQRIKGYSAAEITGQHFSRFYTPEDQTDGLPGRALGRARREGRYDAEGWRVRKDGTRFWAGVVIDAILQDGKLVGFAKITRDLTERRAAQLELEKSREQLFQSQKMEAIGQLTGGLAHDFNNMLTAITGGLDMVKRRLAQGRVSEVDRYIESAQSGASRAAALTHRLLAFARRQTLEPRYTDVAALVAQMRDLLDRTVGPEIEIRTDYGENVWPSMCDSNQLENAILNLCINARDAMPEGGVLTIATANASLTEPDLPHGDYVALSVTDTGTGMEPDVLKHALDPFFTTKPTGQGTGLGLSMVYGFATQSGGQVRLSSRVGEGTTIRIYLPRWEGGAEAPAPTTAVKQPSADTGETILIVDDETSVRMFMSEALKEFGYEIVEASDAASGLKLLESNAHFDLLITDVGMPGGMNGRQMVDASRRTRSKLPVLFVTGYAEKGAMGKNKIDAGLHILNKPFSVELLATRVRELIQK